MTNITILQLVRWLFIVLFQVLILNQIELNRFISPYIYPLFILLLPFETPIWAVLLMSFGTGLFVDTFGNSLGLHTAATVLMGYMRGNLISFKRIGTDTDEGKNTLSALNMRQFFVYSATCILVHHFVFFLLEMFSLSHIGYVLLKTAGSAAVSIALIMLSRYLFTRN